LHTNTKEYIKMNGQIIAGIKRMGIGQSSLIASALERALKQAGKTVYSFDSMGFNTKARGGTIYIKQFNTTANAGFYKYLSRLIDVRNGAIFLKNGITESKWNTERAKALKLDLENLQNAQKIQAERAKREQKEFDERQKEQAEAIACKSESEYEKAVGKKKRDGLHRANKLNPVLIAARGAFLSILRLNILGFASVMNLKQAKAWDDWKNNKCRKFNTDWAKKGRESKVSPPEIEKIQRILYNLGFEPNSVVNPNKPYSKAVGAGALKKALGKNLIKLIPAGQKYKQTLDQTILWYKNNMGKDIGYVSGIGIEPATMTALITAGSGIIVAVLPYIMRIKGVSNVIASECDIQEDEIKKFKQFNDRLEENIDTLEGQKESGIGQAPTLDDLGLPQKLEYIPSEPEKSRITRANDLYQQGAEIYNSFKSSYQAIKDTACQDIALQFQTEQNRYKILQKRLNELQGGLTAQLGNYLPYVGGGLLLYLLLAKRK
jgi:hypothetical protein